MSEEWEPKPLTDDDDRPVIAVDYPPWEDRKVYFRKPAAAQVLAMKNDFGKHQAGDLEDDQVADFFGELLAVVCVDPVATSHGWTTMVQLPTLVALGNLAMEAIGLVPPAPPAEVSEDSASCSAGTSEEDGTSTLDNS